MRSQSWICDCSLQCLRLVRYWSWDMSFKVKVPDGTLDYVLTGSWVPSNRRLLWRVELHDETLEKLLKKLLIRGSKAVGEVLIPLSCVLSRYDNEHASCPLHSHKFGQLTLVLGASRPMLVGDSAMVLHEGSAVHIAAGVSHGLPEQHSKCLPRVSINLFVATESEASSLPLCPKLRSLEPSTQLCAFQWARPSSLDESVRPTNVMLLELWTACCEALGEPPKKRAKRMKHAIQQTELPKEWGVDSKVALDFAGLSEGAKAMCLQRLRKVFDERIQSVRDINSYCSTVIKGIGDTFGTELQPKLRGALKAKLEGSGWSIDDLDSSAIGALAGLPQHSAFEIISSLKPAAVSNLSAFMAGAVKRQSAACPVARALQFGWDSVVQALAGKSEVSSPTLVQVINMACKQKTLESFELACSALLLFPAGSTPPLSTYNKIFKACGDVGRWPKGLELFRTMPEHLQPNRYTYTALFDAVVRGGGPQSVLWALWNDMQSHGVAADQRLMSTMIQGCADSQVVEELLGELDWQGIMPSLELLTSMVGCYRRAGAPTGKTWEVVRLAKSFHLALDCQFLVQVVAALGFANDTGAVVLLMESVRDAYKVEPDVFLYTAAISQCARAGDVTGAETIIAQMQRDQVEPNEHTHCAIIAVYSKARHLNKAVEYFYQVNTDQTLPIEAYCSILSGCRDVLDHKCALRVLKKARQCFGMQMKSACYTLARQSCALAGNDTGAAKVDEWQKMDGVVTHIPTSTVDDPSTGERIPFQPGNDSAEVAACVKSMIASLKKSGYNPQLWQYDPGISSEEREERLQYHTEKKALAWALQHFPQGSSITIRKTIRCCVDCHNAFKVASSAHPGRSLRILDQVRMHEFSAGKCSCGDWWWSNAAVTTNWSSSPAA